MNLLLYEFRKAFNLKYLCVIIVAVLIQIVVGLIPRNYERSYSDTIYKAYMEELGGEYTEEKYSLVLERYDEICKVMAEHEDVITAYKQNEITLDAFDEHNFQYNKALAEQATVEYILQKCEYYQSRGEGVFFYDTDWVDFFSSSGYNYIAALVIICLIIPVFEQEYRSEAVAMLLTARNGRSKICTAKLLSAGVIAFAQSMLLSFTKYTVFMLRYGDNAHLSVENLLGYSGFSGVSLWQYFWNDALLKSVSWVIAALFICVVVTFTKNAVFAFFISFVMLVCPYFVSGFFGGEWFGAVFVANQLGGMYSVTLNIPILFIAYLLKALAYSLLSMKKWNCIA